MKLYLVALVSAALVALGTARAEAAPSFDCAKAKAVIERLICADADLAALDLDMAANYREVRNGYDQPRRDSLLKGQVIWLALRKEACLPSSEKNTNLSAATGCLRQVYGKRIHELYEHKDVQRKEREGLLISNIIDLEAILDEPIDLTAYYPEDMSSIYLIKENQIDRTVSRIPRTCRELFTLTAGLWAYSLDTIGSNSSSIASSRCLNLTRSQYKYKPATQVGSPVDFNNIRLFSTEFGCLFGGEYCADKPASYEKVSEMKGLQIEDGPFPIWDNGDHPLQGHMYISSQGFYVDGMNFSIQNINVGNFTNKNRQEALIQLHCFPDAGTLRATFLLIIYYDPEMNAIRPEEPHPGNDLTSAK